MGFPTTSGVFQTANASDPDLLFAKISGVGPVLQSIAVTPANPSIAAGLTQQFTATGTYSNNTTQNITSTVTWASATTATATIAARGLATAVAQGTSSISATLSGVTGSTVLTVNPPVLQSIAVTPASPSIAAGLTQQFTATGTCSNSTTQNITATVTWASATTATATIAAGGLATAVAQGTSLISATLSGVTGSTVLTVTPPPVFPDLSISKAHVGGGIAQGQRAGYTIVVNNTGTATSSGTITVIDMLDSNLTFVSGTGGGFACSAVAQLVTCTSTVAIGLAASATINLTVAVSGSAPALIDNSVSVSCTCTESNSRNNTSNTDTVSVAADITGQLAMTASGIATSRAGVSSGTVTLTNNTASTLASPIQLLFTNLPAGVTVISPSGTLAGSAYLTQASSLAPGASMTITTRFNNPARGAVTYTPVILSGGL